MVVVTASFVVVIQYEEARKEIMVGTDCFLVIL